MFTSAWQTMDGGGLDITDISAVDGLTNQLLEALVEQMPSGVLVLEAPSGRVLFSNDQMADFWGSAALCAGVTSGDWKGYWPDGREYEAEEWPHARALRGEQVANPVEIEVVKANGTHAMASMAVTPLRSNVRELRAVLLTCLDVTERRQKYTARKFLNDANSVLSSSSDYLTTLRNLARLAVPTLADWCTIDLLNANGTLQRVAVEHIDGARVEVAAELARSYPPGNGAGSGTERVVRDGEAELLARVTTEQLDEWSWDARHREILDELGTRSVMLVPLIARGKILGSIGFVAGPSGRTYDRDDLDVAQELASKAALAIDNTRLAFESQAATEAKSDFLAVMSHELRTPLTAIIGYSELLQLGVPEPVTPRQYEQAERIEVSARQLLQMIEEILTLVTLQSGEGRVRKRTVKVNDLVERVQSIVEPMARAKGLTLTMEGTPDDADLETDPDKVLQILLNLLSNAVKFTDEGEIGLKVRIRDQMVVFEVYDTGIGVDSDQLEQIFEPFWQAERPITRKAGGTGLGLTIAMKLTEMLKGSLDVDSNEGGGSRFLVSLPIGGD